MGLNFGGRAVHRAVRPVFGGFFAPHLTCGEVETGLHKVRCTIPVRCG